MSSDDDPVQSALELLADCQESGSLGDFLEKEFPGVGDAEVQHCIDTNDHFLDEILEKLESSGCVGFRAPDGTCACSWDEETVFLCGEMPRRCVVMREKQCI